MNDRMQGTNNQNAISLYQGQDGPVEDFPVLKAFQQYIDAEQAKARKRLVCLGIFFGVLTGAVIAVFVALLINMSHRNQMLNDRLVDFVMKDRDRPPVVVQQPQNQDNAAIISLTAKMGELQQKLLESQQKADEAERVRKAEDAERARKAEEAERVRKAEEAEKARRAEEEIQKARKAAEEAEKARQQALAPKMPTAQEIEIAQLKALLAAEVERNKKNAQEEKEKAEAEKKRKREEELEAYRRKHYPELYEDEDVEEIPAIRTRRRKTRTSPSRPKVRYEIDDEPNDDDLDDVLDTVDAVLQDKKSRRSYHDDEEQPHQNRKPVPKVSEPKKDSEPVKVVSPKTNVVTKVAAPATNQATKVAVAMTNQVSKVAVTMTNQAMKAAAPATNAPAASLPAVDDYVIPVEVKGKSSSWRIP